MEKSQNVKRILVTGASGQLGRSLQDLAHVYPNMEFLFLDSNALDITDHEAVAEIFKTDGFDYCINCAAYTNVEQAEKSPEIAFKVNAEAVKNLALACKKHGVTLIHISTDYVFDGAKSQLYTENDRTNPISVYGATKLDGELAVKSALKEYFILRTSWLYSEHGQNFVKNMLRLGAEKEVLNIISDQIGTPTYVKDLAFVIIKLITENNTSYGTYHYSNEGVASWYDFTKAIFEYAHINCKVIPINTDGYPSPAKRPAFSVMDKSKIKSVFGIEIPYWRERLKKVISKINSQETES